MENNNLKAFLAEKYKTLPPLLQQAIIETDLPNLIKNLSSKYSLHVDQAGSLENEIMLILLGLENYNSFYNNLTREIRVPQNIATEIAKDTDELIFKKVKTYLVDSTIPKEGSTVNDTNETEALNKQAEMVMTQEIKPKEENYITNTPSNTPKDNKINFVEDKLKNINVSNSERISLIPKTETHKKITDPYLEPLD